MCSLTLYRYHYSDKETLGMLIFKANNVTFTWNILELPWKNNKNKVSCIPEGSYDIFIDTSYKNGLKEHNYKVVELKGVPERSQIQFHIGNYPKNSHGCILVAAECNYDYRTKVNSLLHIKESRKGYTAFFNIVTPYIISNKLQSVEIVKL